MPKHAKNSLVTNNVSQSCNNLVIQTPQNADSRMNDSQKWDDKTMKSAYNGHNQNMIKDVSTNKVKSRQSELG